MFDYIVDWVTSMGEENSRLYIAGIGSYLFIKAWPTIYRWFLGKKKTTTTTEEKKE